MAKKMINPFKSLEKKKLLEKINKGIIEKHKKNNVPMIFKTKDCSSDEWIGMNLNTKKLQKLRFISLGERTKIIDVDSGKEI